MAFDWVKMRTDLYRDPKVIVMADLLGAELGVTLRNVTRNAVVGALVSIWGVVRHQGHDENTDSRLENIALEIIDDITNLPGMGKAMAAVGWVEVDSQGLLFPRFYEKFNTDPADEEKKKNRERQRRFRERKREGNSNVTRNVTRNAKRNAREEKRRDKNPPTPLGGNGCLKASGLALEDISRDQLGKRAMVEAWAERNIPRLSRDTLNKILACSAKSRRIGRDPPRLFLSLVRLGLEQGKWQFEQKDEDAVARSRRQPKGEIG